MTEKELRADTIKETLPLEQGFRISKYVRFWTIEIVWPKVE